MEGRDSRTYAIIGAAMRVHRELGSGFLEKVYQEALAVELEEGQVPFEREVDLPIHYRGRCLQTAYRADFVCHREILVETKATKGLSDVDQAQLIHYLKATKRTLGLLINFGTPSLQHRRLVRNHP